VMSTAFALLGLICAVTGASALYLASPNQQMLAQRIAPRIGCMLGIAALIVSLTSFLQVTGPATAVYVLLTAVMLIWTVLPLAFAWLRKRKAS